MRHIELTQIRGVGPKRAEVFASLGVTDLDTLLHLLPRDHLDYSCVTPVLSLSHGLPAAVRVRIDSEPSFARVKGMTLVTARAHDETGAVTLRWFNQPFRRTQAHAGETVIACGRADLRRGRMLINPSLHDSLPGVLPVYPRHAGLPQRAVRDAVREALTRFGDEIDETLPLAMREANKLCGLREALHNAHYPADQAALHAAQKRLAFENTLLYLLAVENRRAEQKRENGVRVDCTGVLAVYEGLLPFRMTAAQRRAINEISADLAAPWPMNRLLEGDVGSGKTAVAAYAMLAHVCNGWQAALLAPTEVLAEQHYETLASLFGASVCLLTGRQRKSERDKALLQIASGDARYIIGTHALLGEAACFNRLGLVVTDEQHRFGVSQRAALAAKGARPNVLVMSATPIPRTLALILYGDLDISVLDELPPGRLPVKTSYIPSDKRTDMYRYIAQQAALGRQAFVVCPAIEDGEEMELVRAEKLYTELMALLPDTRIGLLHGKQRPGQKRENVEAFRNGQTQLLVTTTVIEVGVHVPNAAIMAVENADRFGLAQLHQLRGRVGRGDTQGYCFLLAECPGETARERFRALLATNDGFAIAESDLLLRGYGDLLGTRQHGAGEEALAAGIANTELLYAAQQAAREALECPTPVNDALFARAEERYLRMADRLAMN